MASGTTSAPSLYLRSTSLPVNDWPTLMIKLHLKIISWPILTGCSATVDSPLPEKERNLPRFICWRDFFDRSMQRARWRMRAASRRHGTSVAKGQSYAGLRGRSRGDAVASREEVRQQQAARRLRYVTLTMSPFSLPRTEECRNQYRNWRKVAKLWIVWTVHTDVNLLKDGQLSRVTRLRCNS